ncbi:MAG: hypothetical protein M3063_16095 [Actinomycetota bacterium]|nr:hypothetical protein [Actinomycetota bacterium]
MSGRAETATRDVVIAASSAPDELHDALTRAGFVLVVVTHASLIYRHYSSGPADPENPLQRSAP